MDLTKNDSVGADTAMAAVETLRTTALAAIKGIRDKAKTKEAQSVADKGNYWTLRPYLKSLIPIPGYIIDQVKDKGISEYAVIALPEQALGASNATIVAKLQKYTVDPMPSGTDPDVASLRTSFIKSIVVPEGGGGVNYKIDPTTGDPVVNDPVADKAKSALGNVTPYLPYIVGGLGIILAIYFITKR